MRAGVLCMQLSVDIRTMKKEDATFRVPFKLTANRNDFIHAIVAYFDVSFTHGHKPIGFSTSPRWVPAQEFGHMPPLPLPKHTTITPVPHPACAV